ncbi:DnaJ domain-containing protein [Kribbella sp. NPDC048915]|uniref:DUF4190 domain-containing protein n=1 Tax=Kribbella sp. NPDC048915 TaxID=3155148 RepID=UPI0033D9BCF8
MNARRDFRDLDGADPWKLLDVSRDADVIEIKRNYRRLSRDHHTDVGGDPARQAKLNRAYAILSDPARRTEYARLLTPPTRPESSAAQPNSGPPGLSGQAVAALLTVPFCAPLSIFLAVTALRRIRWTAQRGKSLAWLALFLNATLIIWITVGTALAIFRGD